MSGEIVNTHQVNCTQLRENADYITAAGAAVFAVSSATILVVSSGSSSHLAHNILPIVIGSVATMAVGVVLDLSGLACGYVVDTVETIHDYFSWQQ